MDQAQFDNLSKEEQNKLAAVIQEETQKSALATQALELTELCFGTLATDADKCITRIRSDKLDNTEKGG